MDGSRQQAKDASVTKGKVTKSCGKHQQPKEKPALSPIEEEETDSPDSSGDSAINCRGVESEGPAKNYPYDLLRVSLCEDYAEEETLLEDLEDAGSHRIADHRQPETPPFLTARNRSDHEAGSKSDDSCSSSTSCEKSSLEEDRDYEDEEEEEEEEDDVSIPGERSSDEVDPPSNDEDRGEDLDKDPEGNLEENSKSPDSRKSRKTKASKHSQPSRGKQLRELETSVDFLRIKIAKSEKDIRCLKKRLLAVKNQNRSFVVRYEEDKNVAKESLRLDLEVWIKKLNESLKSYLGEWQQRERLRLNEEISRISDVYSQEIAKSLESNLKEWLSEDARKILEVIDKRDRSRQDKERANANAIYRKIQTHLENLEKRNGKSYASFRRQIDKWEERLRDEVVKLREEDSKKLKEQFDLRHREEERKESPEATVKKEKRLERCEEKEKCAFPGSEALLRVEEKLLKRLRESSAKDTRRTEQIVRGELRAQRRRLAKLMNEKISELWMAFEEFGWASPEGSGGAVDRARPLRRASSGLRAAAAARNDLEERRVGSRAKDAWLNGDVHGGGGGGGGGVRRGKGGKFVGLRVARTGDSTRGSSELEDGDRDSREDEDDDEDEMSLSRGASATREKPETPSASVETAST